MRTLMENICVLADAMESERKANQTRLLEAQADGREDAWIPPALKAQPLRTVMSRDGATGAIASYKAMRLLPFSDALERDLLTLMEWDYAIDSIDWKPVDVLWEDACGHRQRLTPHVLVRPARYLRTNPKRKDTVFCIVSAQELRAHLGWWKQAIREAREQVKPMGWRFQLLSDCCVNPVYAANARFLLRFRGPQFQIFFSRKRLAIRDAVWDTVRRLRERGRFTPRELLAEIPERLGTRTQILQMILSHYATYMIQCDLLQPFGLDTPSWACGDGGWGFQSDPDWKQPENDWYR